MSEKEALKKLGLETSPCPIVYSSSNLRFYEPGAFFTEGKSHWIQINPKLLKLKAFGYDTTTVIMHELVHALRKDFEDSFWEELIAYQVSKYSYQKLLGPFFAKKKVQMMCIAAPIVSSLSGVFGFHYALWGYLALFGFVFLNYLREFSRLKRVKNALKASSKDPFLDLVSLPKKQLELLEKNS